MTDSTNTAGPLPTPTLHAENGVLTLEGLPLTQIAEQFGTPTYVYSKAALTSAFEAWRQALSGRKALVCYAVKANSNLGILSVFAQLGAGFDIVSGGELARVLAAGGRADRVVFPIALRVNPDVDPKTHPYISTGLKGNKFGVAFADAQSLYRRAAALPNLHIAGIACHIGSQLLDPAPVAEAAQKLADLVDRLAIDGIVLEHIDLGGGLGIRYRDETPPSVAQYLAPLLKVFEGRKEELCFEPGRSLVGNAGLLLTRIEYLKPGETKNFAIVDAAMNDLARPALYDAWHEVVEVVGREVPTQAYDIVGPICESGDFLARGRELAVAEGDLLAILSAGAYGMTMSSNYNTRPRAAEVIVDGEQAHLVRARESVSALFADEKPLG
ncbi:MAG: diaminopimelate decarboxylase [Thauera sp.]|nr:diaminopimelate decarboxylase [Thauera sp.]MDI3490383.1 diaminopimelate decarboxylase [Thauera sp.]